MLHHHKNDNLFRFKLLLEQGILVKNCSFITYETIMFKLILTDPHMMMEVDLSMFYDYLTLYGKMCNISIEIVDKNIFEKVCTIYRNQQLPSLKNITVMPWRLSVLCYVLFVINMADSSSSS